MPTDEDENEVCSDGVDNDGDGWFDGDDPDCTSFGEEAGFGVYACNDSIDNDGDGYIDAADDTCPNAVASTEAAECSDGLDNDTDGWIDEEDPDCENGAEEFGIRSPLNATMVLTTTPMEKSTSSTTTVKMPWTILNSSTSVTTVSMTMKMVGPILMIPAVTAKTTMKVQYEPSLCNDGEDNDEDGSSMRTIPAAKTETTLMKQTSKPTVTMNSTTIPMDGSMKEIPTAQTEKKQVFGETQCNDEEDNDADGYADSDDPNCDSAWDDREQTSLSNCTDGSDNDEDGWTDGEDPDCIDHGQEDDVTNGGACNDHLDNDADGFVDHEDIGCENALDLDEYVFQCEDGLDNDGDGWTISTIQTAPMATTTNLDMVRQTATMESITMETSSSIPRSLL